MKFTMRCPKCGYNHILYISMVPDRGYPGVEPAKIALIPQEVGVFMGLKATQNNTFGDVEAGVCRRCGYVEYYVKDPSTIPVDGQYVREIIGPE